MAKNAQTKTNDTNLIPPPVVAVLGHVDHGKTTLLDAIRKTSVADKEKGGITQKVGASSVEIVHDGAKRSITFIDTPGHEAFTKMRGRGANASDMGLLIVSAVDGVKPQTKESIKALQDSKIPFIVVLTKSDLPTKNVEKTKQELLKENIMLEGYGGDVPVIEVSARTNENIKELLDLILLMSDMHKKDHEEKGVRAIVIEAKMDTRSGSKAAVIIKNGTINVRDELKVDGKVFKVRTLFDTYGKSIQSATVGDAVEILGFEKVPEVGAIIVDTATEVATVEPVKEVLKREMVYMKKEEHKGLSVVLVADSQGSLEAIVNSLPSGISIVAKKTGEVTEADILLAKSTGSILLAFNVKIKPEIANFAFIEKVLARSYEIIYELLDEITDALEGKLLSQIEQVYGRAKILARFPFEKTFAFGISVTEGRIARGDRIRILRGEEEVVGETTIASLRIGKESTSKVEKGNEAGIILSAGLDIKVGDMILSHS